MSFWFTSPLRVRHQPSRKATPPVRSDSGGMARAGGSAPGAGGRSASSGTGTGVGAGGSWVGGEG
ncbi:hypothetical protein FW320_31225, partial [Azospirillum sp. Vi22]|nr:hypothetical protein [Azospirillum baldaniorum]